MIGRFIDWCVKPKKVYTNNLNYWFVSLASWYVFFDVIRMLWF